MIPETTFADITAWFGEYHRPVLMSHRRPDGDALGSLAATALLLRHLDKEPSIVLFDAMPERYAFFEPMAKWYDWERVRDVLPRESDAVVLLDTCSLAQLEPGLPFLAQAPPILVIDHHATRDQIGVREGDMRVFDDTASATSLLIAEWARHLDVPLEGDLAMALFVGIATDCGWFRFSNTDARTMRVAADLVAAGVELSDIYNRLYQQEPLAKLRLVAHVLTNLDLRADGKLAVMYLRKGDFEATGAARGMTEDLVNEAARLAGTEATLLFIEEEDGEIRVNLRSKRSLDVSELARRFGGGGHSRAAGLRLRGDWDKAVPRLIQETEQAL